MTCCMKPIVADTYSSEAMSDKTDTLRAGLISGPSAYAAAIDVLVSAAKSSLLILDPDLDQGDYDSARRIEALRRLLLSPSCRRVVFLLERDARLDRYCPRLMRLYQEFSHAMQIHLLPEHTWGINLPFLLADGRNVLRWLSRDDHRYGLDLDDPAGANRLTDTFEDLLAQAGPPLGTKPLGL